MAGREAQQLASKEAGLFRQVVKFYESKQYKKGIKAAEQILRKHPEHGETLAMKGLILSYQDKKTEAYELVRRGLRADLKSHVCWHVYGLLWRADNNYEEAIKCYKNALRIDKDNLQILRDLAQLQIQMRDYSGFVETRQTLLHLKAANRNNWISFAIAHHLNKNYDLAVQVLDGFESTQEEVPKGEEYEHSEMLFYKLMILEEGGRVSEALRQLEANREGLRDRAGAEEARGRLLLQDGRPREAEEVYRRLLNVNPDNHRYHDGLRESLGLPPMRPDKPTSEQLARLRDLYADLEAAHPKSSTPRRIPLDFLEGKDFEGALDSYVRPFLAKGVPSLFSDLKSLYRDPQKAGMIQRKFESLLAGGGEEPDAVRPLANGSAGSGGGAATTVFWARLFLARHYDRLGETERALRLVEECLEEKEDGDDIEAYGVKSRILKHAGDLNGAAAAAVKAQSLDLADRYLNSVAAKALFRANATARAERMAARFTKDSEQPNMLHEMQCMWYEIECGSAFLRQRDYGRALKNFTAVLKHFATFQEDQFDFHSYCVRKMTLRSYIRMLRMEDSLLENQYYAKAAFAAVSTYLELAAGPARQQQALEKEEALLATMSIEDQRKHKQRRKKEAQRKAKDSERQKPADREGGKAAGKKGGERGADTDPDPDGIELAAVADPLAEAAALLQSLRVNAPGELRTHLLSFEVAMRRGKQLLALQAVKQAIALAGRDDPRVHAILVRFCQGVSGLPGGPQNGAAEGQHAPPEVVQELISSQVRGMLGGQPLPAFHEAFCAAGGNSLAHRAADLEIRALLSPAAKQQQLARFLEAGPAKGRDATTASHAECVEVGRLLEGRLAAPEAAERWAEQCRRAFPFSSHFRGERRTPDDALDSLFGSQAGETAPSVLRPQDR